MIRSSILSGTVALAAALTLTACSGTRAADWGSIKGKFVYKGEAKAEPITLTKDPEYCGEHKPVDEKVSLGKDNALKNVFVYLYVARGKKAEIHPDYKPGDPVVLANKGCRFEPHALTLWNVNELEIVNDDTIGHNTNLNFNANVDFNQLIAHEQPLKKKLDKTEASPAPVTCNIHPWMNGSVLVRDNPYMAVTGDDGTFEIKNVAAGDQEFVIWHEANGFLHNLKVGSMKADRKGQIKVKIPAGDTLDLGTIEVAPANLGK